MPDRAADDKHAGARTNGVRCDACCMPQISAGIRGAQAIDRGGERWHKTSKPGAPMTIWILLACIISVVLAFALLYNRLVRLRQMAHEGWSGILVQLQRRADLVPELVETVKGYAAHERTTLAEIVRLRAAANALGDNQPAERGQIEQQLSGALSRILALAEAYPDLKASGNFLALQQALSDTEEQIQFARRYYNGAVRMLNIQIEQVPSNLVARMCGFTRADYFELLDPSDAAPVRVELGN